MKLKLNFTRTITMKIIAILIIGVAVISAGFLFLSSRSFDAVESNIIGMTDELLEEDIDNKNKKDAAFLKSYGENLAKYLSIISAPALWNFETDLVNSFASSLLQLPHIEYAIIYGENGDPQAGEKPDNVNMDDILQYEQEIHHEDNFLGSVEIGMDRSYLESMEAESRETKETLLNTFSDKSKEITSSRFRMMIYVTLIGSGALVVIAGFFIYLMTRPLRKVRRIVEDLSKGRGDLTVRLDIRSNDEVGRLSGSLNQFLETQNAMVCDIKQVSVAIDENANQLASIVKDENELALEIVEKVDEIESESQNISSSLEQVTASVEEVAANSKTVSNSSQEITKTAENSKAYVQESSEAATKIEQKMGSVTEQMNNTATSVEKLVDNLMNIESILESINAIAEQTNLLALNAAIEAARAGEAGKGFSVVADEIRKLAEESKGATDKVANILKEISGQSNEVREKTEDVNVSVKEASDISINVRNRLEELMEQIDNMVEVSNEGYNLSNLQKASTDEISQAVEASNVSTQSLVEKQQTIVELINKLKTGIDTVEESGEKMQRSAKSLSSKVNQFKIEK